MKNAVKIHVSGVVQGVGFRPFVYRQAKLHLISGWVKNSTDGVDIFAQGQEDLVNKFCMSVADNAPAAAKVEQLDIKEVPLEDFDNFQILQSESSSQINEYSKQTLVSPDLATCDDCIDELFDKNNLRYRYPFINCTNCGPRFTIINELPYDRNKTSMKDFIMCKSCRAEFEDQTNRRFHAQPNACFECGPHITWTEDCKNMLTGETLEKSDLIISKCIELLLAGKIVAIKGLGGFHFACDATNKIAVKNLRQKKERSNKAFAIMAQDVDDAKLIAQVNETEEKVLTSVERPIVLLKKKEDCDDVLAENVICGLPEVGVMLPYTPLQHILFHDFKKAGGQFLVMTSGNIYDDPIVTDDKLAYSILEDVADAFLGNNRQIVSGYDDSVVRVIDAGGTDAIQVIRRARSYAPSPIKVKLENPQKQKFATGAQQKNTFAVSRPSSSESDKYNAEVFVSQHIGEVENGSSFETWEKTKRKYQDIFNLSPTQLVCDMHPEYITSKWAEQNKSSFNEINKIQHHYAHIKSVMYENQLSGPVCGFAFDGTGFGVDKNIWGGECLLCNLSDFERFANFAYVPMPGGTTAIKNAIHMAYGVLWAFDLLEHSSSKKALKDLTENEQANLCSLIESGNNCPMTSSVGRLFDAASALLGICNCATYQGEPAIMLEAALWDFLKNSDKKDFVLDKRYQIKITKNVATKDSTAQDTSVVLLDARSTFKALLDDLQSNVEVGKITINFHLAFVDAILKVSQLVLQLYGIKQVALSGGVFMNRFLIEQSIKVLIENGFSVAINRELPPNDGNISLGQLK